MLYKTFKGGIHLQTNKATDKKKIKPLPLPERVVIPVSQHTGKPSTPIVKLGDKVKTGQKIAEAEGFVSVPQHSSISGEVKEIAHYPHPVLGRDALSIVIESDGKDKWIKRKKHDYTKLARSEIVEIIKNGGIVGLGGAAFPTHVKLSPPKEKPIDTLILNGAECEPYLTVDHRTMLERTEDIIKGAKIIMKVLECDRCIIAIESNKKDAIEKFKNLIKDERIEVFTLKVKYPQGEERQIIKACLKREVPSGGLPMDVGVVVQNVGTVCAIYDAVHRDIPLLERSLTISGSGIKEPQNVKVRIGTILKNVIDNCGGYADGVGKIIMGGPLMGIAQYTDEVPILKATSGIIVQTEDEVSIEEEQPCIRCSRCVDVCPMRLLPCEIANYAEHHNFDKCEELDIMDCKECGSCSFVCPAKRNIAHLVKFAKNEIMSKM